MIDNIDSIRRLGKIAVAYAEAGKILVNLIINITN